MSLRLLSWLNKKNRERAKKIDAPWGFRAEFSSPPALFSPVQPWARRCSLLLVYVRWTLNGLSMFANQLMEMKRWSTGQRLLATCSFPQVYVAGDVYVQKGEIGLAWGRDGGDTCTNYQKRGGNEKAPKVKE